MNLIALITTLVLLYLILKKRSNILASVAKYKYGTGKTETAFKLYAFADKIGKLSFDHKVMRAYLTLKEGEIDEANKLFNLIGMEKLEPAKRAKLKQSHALVMWKKGDTDDAIEMLEYVHENYPSTTTYGSLGYMYAYGERLQKALEYNLEAYEYNSDDPIIIDNLAYTYLKLKDYKNAEKYYNELFALDPTFPEGYFEYGKYLVSAGKKEEGLNLVKKALNCRFSFLSMFERRDVLDYLEREGENISNLV